MHIGVTSHLWLKSALHALSHPCMCTCGCVLVVFSSPVSVLYFVPPFSFQPFQMFTSEFNERSRSNPLCDFRLGTVVTSDYETPLTLFGPWQHWQIFVRCVLVNTLQYHDTVDFVQDSETEYPQLVAEPGVGRNHGKTMGKS